MSNYDAPTFSYANIPISYSKPAVLPVSYYTASKSLYASSPPEAAESVTTGSGMNSAYSATSSSYAGSSSGDYDSNSSGANGVDLHEYMQDRFSVAFDPLPLDRSLATQTQT